MYRPKVPRMYDYVRTLHKVPIIVFEKYVRECCDKVFYCSRNRFRPEARLLLIAAQYTNGTVPTMGVTRTCILQGLCQAGKFL